MNHTPGPWNQMQSTPREVADANGISVAITVTGYMLGHEITLQQAEANARLIAAAPDLLAALTECVTALQAELENRQEAGADMTEYAEEIANPLEIARAAIEKAGL